MSSKQKATPKKPKAAKIAEKEARRLPASTIIKNVGRAAALLVIAGIASPVSQLNLSPVYGSIPTSLHHQRSMTITAVLAFMSRKALKKYVSAKVAEYIAVIAYWTPVIQFLLFQFSGKLGIDNGPFIIESLTYFPLLFLSAYAAGDLLEDIDLTRLNLHPTIGEVLVPTASYFTVSSVAKIAGTVLPDYIGTHLYFTRIGLQLLIGSISAFLTPSKVILLAAPAIVHTLFANPHHPSESAFRRANETLFSTQNYTILARQESLTGYLSILENDGDSAFRLMRCDHSLLGGEWLVTPSSASKGQKIRETIFSVFVLLEAVRLVENQQVDAVAVPDSDKSALVIGLGIGTAPNALISHGIKTTIVELDPVVHHYATKYFNLSPQHTAIIDDAVSYVGHKSKSHPGSFDYVIHDVFTGGAEPVYLFTEEFLQGLSTLLADDGVAAINYAGDMSLPSTRLVLNTIHSVFPACRLFRDSPQEEGWKPGDPDFINMVVFCVKNDHGKGKAAITFRQADQNDWKDSIARQNYLRPIDDHEVKFDYTKPEDGGKIMKKSGVSELEKWHKQGAVNHWRVMRSVLPDAVWEMW